MLSSVFNGYKVHLVETVEEIEILKQLLDPKVGVGVDTEDTGLCYVRDKVVGLCVSCGKSYSKDDYQGFYLPIRHAYYDNNLPVQPVMDLAQHIIDNFKSFWFNRNYDAFMLENEGCIIPFPGKMHDVQIMCHLVNQESYPAMKKFAYNYLKWDVLSLEETTGEDKNFGNTDPRVSYVYAAGDALMTVMLGRHMWNQYPYIRKIYALDNKVGEAIRRMSKQIILVNYKIVDIEREKEQQKLRETQMKINQLLGYQINPGSGPQKADALSRYTTLKAKTKTGKWKMDEEVLSQIVRTSEPGDQAAILAQLFIDYAEQKKYLSSYLDKLMGYEGRDIRINYSGVNAASGRLSSGGAGKKDVYYVDLNIQNIPKVEEKKFLHMGSKFGYYLDDNPDGAVGKMKCKSGLRAAFYVPEGYSWMSYDFAGEELRLLANFSGEPNFINPLLEGKDLHTYVAEKMFGFSSPENRTATKTLNFAIAYGANEFTIARKLNKAVDYAKQLYDKYFKTNSRLKAWIDNQHKTARRTGFVFTYFGRPRAVFKYYNSSDRSDHGYADRTSQNHPAQGCLPMDGYLELTNSVVLHKTVLGQRLNNQDAVIIPVGKGENECFLLKFNTGDFIICDLNHKFIKGKGDNLFEVSLKDGLKSKVNLSPLHSKKKFSLRQFFKRSTNNAGLLKLHVNKHDVIKDDNKQLSAAFWKLALTGHKFEMTDTQAAKMRSLGSIYGFNVVLAGLRSDKYKVTFRRNKTTRLYDWKVLGRMQVGTASVLKGYHKYPAQGFWNKNTGGDVIRMCLNRHFDLVDTNPEYAEKVLLHNTVHDELNFAIKDDYRYKADKLIQGYMTIHPSNFRVPLVVDGSMGQDWGHLCDFRELNEDGTIKVLKSGDLTVFDEYKDKILSA